MRGAQKWGTRRLLRSGVIVPVLEDEKKVKHRKVTMTFFAKETAWCRPEPPENKGQGWAWQEKMPWRKKSGVDHEGPHKPGREAKRPSGRRGGQRKGDRVGLGG